MLLTIIINGTEVHCIQKYIQLCKFPTQVKYESWWTINFNTDHESLRQVFHICKKTYVQSVLPKCKYHQTQSFKTQNGHTAMNPGLE